MSLGRLSRIWNAAVHRVMHSRIPGLALAAIVLTITVRKLLEIDWGEVGGSLSAYEPSHLALAVLLVVPALAACAAYDLIGRRITRHRLSWPRSMLISFAGYFLSLNVGALVGGLLLRFRLYTASGLKALTVGQVVGLTILTNWLGYLFIAGIALTAAPPPKIFGFAPGAATFRLIGTGCLLATGGYLLFCFLRGGSTIRIRETTMIVPGVPTALLQLGLACTNWAAAGAVLASLMPGLGWLDVMPVLMLSALAGIWSHVPGGIGVTEAVFASQLGDRLPEAEVIAAVLVFRAVYYLIPLIIALGVYACLEWKTSGMRLATHRRKT